MEKMKATIPAKETAKQRFFGTTTDSVTLTDITPTNGGVQFLRSEKILHTKNAMRNRMRSWMPLNRPSKSNWLFDFLV